MFRKLCRGEGNLTKTNMILMDFRGKVPRAGGALCIDLTIGNWGFYGSCGGRCITIEAQPWDYDQVICVSVQADDTDFLKMTDFGIEPIEVGSSKKK